MTRIFSLIFCLAMLVAFGCKPKVEPKVDEATGNTFFGAEFLESNVMKHADLVAQVQAQDTVVGQVSGLVTGVCQAKGCWITLADKNTKEGEEFFVKFKDYGFFVPLDMGGKEVTLNGKAYKEITSVDELRHYAEDEGKSEEEIAAITEPMEELKFMADGVLLKE